MNYKTRFYVFSLLFELDCYWIKLLESNILYGRINSCDGRYPPKLFFSHTKKLASMAKSPDTRLPDHNENLLKFYRFLIDVLSLVFQALNYVNLTVSVNTIFNIITIF